MSCGQEFEFYKAVCYEIDSQFGEGVVRGDYQWINLYLDEPAFIDNIIRWLNEIRDRGKNESN